MDKFYFPYGVYYAGQINASQGFWGKTIEIPLDFNQHLISALMVTRGNLELVKRGIYNFKKQKWKNKELVIVCDSVTNDLRNLVDQSLASINLIEAPKGLTLGDYRNISISNSKGDFVCQWDDDDFYSADRMSICMKTLIDTASDAVFFQRWWIWWPEKSLIFVSSHRVWEGSIFARRSVVPIYPSMKKREDTIMVDYMLKHLKTTMIDCPDHYCYMITGNNTWDNEHFEEIFKQASFVIKEEHYEKALDNLDTWFNFKALGVR
jgi:glycosyltransferase involved in cell wall biosynthesis